MPLSSNATARKLWVDYAVRMVTDLHLDGLNFDYEEPLNSTDPRREYVCLRVHVCAAHDQVCLRVWVCAAQVHAYLRVYGCVCMWSS